jgi:hypothetical protein
MRGEAAQARQPDGSRRRTSPHGIARIAYGRFISVRQGGFNARTGALLHTAAMVGSSNDSYRGQALCRCSQHRLGAALNGRAVTTSA